MNSPESDARKDGRVTPMSPQPVILGGLLAALIAMFVVALQPGFRGGHYLTTMIAICIVLVGMVFVRTAILGHSLTQDGGDDAPLKVSEDSGLGWSEIARASAVISALFLAVILLGMVVGLTLAAFAILTLQMKVPVRTAAAMAAFWGVVIPVAFGVVLRVSIWPGLVPELIPGWIGGGLLPPL